MRREIVGRLNAISENMQRSPPRLNLASSRDRLIHSTPQPLHRLSLSITVSQDRPDQVEDVLLWSKRKLDEWSGNRSSGRMLEMQKRDE